MEEGKEGRKKGKGKKVERKREEGRKKILLRA